MNNNSQLPTPRSQLSSDPSVANGRGSPEDSSPSGSAPYSLERDLLKHMFDGDLAICQRMTAIGNWAMAENSLRNAITKLHQMAALPGGRVPNHLITEI